jgi:hypothetical protein
MKSRVGDTDIDLRVIRASSKDCHCVIDDGEERFVLGVGSSFYEALRDAQYVANKIAFSVGRMTMEEFGIDPSR